MALTYTPIERDVWEATTKTDSTRKAPVRDAIQKYIVDPFLALNVEQVCKGSVEVDGKVKMVGFSWNDIASDDDYNDLIDILAERNKPLEVATLAASINATPNRKSTGVYCKVLKQEGGMTTFVLENERLRTKNLKDKADAIKAAAAEKDKADKADKAA